MPFAGRVHVPNGTFSDVGQGLGVAQHAILDALEQQPLTIDGLAELTGRTPRRVLAAVRSLERRGLVEMTRQSFGRKGIGSYGGGGWTRNLSIISI